ncbi:hypothetical protein A9Z60_04660 [Moraxella nonliquefaciens]|uniref:Peptidyl-prolyl cis-trans isomerase n=2 Tax=Moraxella nonliquefaciens TaxID=478 RepID=A0A1B8PI41_MORNO|nr:hypothetical protein A9Z60_04660 [Moraxella nonliquefaciens]
MTALMASMLALSGCNKDNSVVKPAKSANNTNISEQSSEMDKISYILGHDAGKNLKEMDGDINPKIIAAAISEGFEGKESKFTDEQARAIFEEYQKRKETEATKELETKAATNKEAGAKFLAENKAKEDVKTTPSGLQYKVITQGTGTKPKPTDVVVAHYEGKTIDGKVFDSSYERGEPAQFDLAHMIPGFTEGVQLMPAGSKYEFYMPSELGYGETGAPPVIEPNSALIFTVELLDEADAKKAVADTHAATEAQMAEMMKQIETQTTQPATNQ